MESNINFQKEKKIEIKSNLATTGKALYKILFGILEELDMTQKELAILVNRNQTTISEWAKRKSVSVSKKMDMNDYQIFEFIDLYKSLSNFFSFKKDRIQWLREKNVGLNNQRPLDLIAEDPRNLSRIKNLVNRLANP